MSVASKIAAIPTLASTITFKDVSIPESVASTLELFKTNTGLKSASANEWTIDVFPDQIPLITYLSKLAATTSKKADNKDEPKTSLATVTMYYVAVFQAFLLLSDLHVRPSPSAHAQVWQNSSYRHKFAQWLLTLPVPQEMESLLAQFSATDLDSIKNVFFVPSAAGFDLDHFFGRFIPVPLYAAIHDCIATMPGNSAPADIWADLLPRPLFSAPSGTGNAVRTFYVADFLGIRPAGTAISSKYAPIPIASKWYQSFSSIFNPVLFRDFHRRSSLATLNLTPVSTTSKASINAYDILFGATPGNLTELKVVLQNVASTINGCASFKNNLSQILSKQTGMNILVHGMSTYALPVWYKNTSTQAGHLASTSKIAPETPSARATHIKFLNRPTKTLATTIRPASATDNAGMTFTGPFNLVYQNVNDHYPQPDDFMVFSEETNNYPRVHIVDYNGDHKVDAHLALLTGKLIETFELDGTVISVPNVNKPLGMQNVEFFDSAIPLKYVVRSTLVTTDGLASAQPMPRRLPRASSSLQASSLVHDRNTVRVPILATGSATGITGQIVETAVPTFFPGLTFKYIDWIKYAQSFFGFSSAITSSSTTDNDIALTAGRFYVWSPYTYTSLEGDEQDNCLPDLHGNRTYFLTNLRTIFGTKSVLYESAHAMEAMPV